MKVNSSKWIFVLIIGLLFSCGSEEITPQSISVGNSFNTQEGQEVKLYPEDNSDKDILLFSLKTISIQDSRCPKDAQCISAGYAEVNLAVLVGGKELERVQLHLYQKSEEAYKEVEVQNQLYGILLENVTPDPGQVGMTKPEDRKAYLTVTEVIN